jgi:hypothetical protein
LIREKKKALEAEVARLQEIIEDMDDFFELGIGDEQDD